jgi:type VI secretion system secreted protein VgrG
LLSWQPLAPVEFQITNLPAGRQVSNDCKHPLTNRIEITIFYLTIKDKTFFMAQFVGIGIDIGGINIKRFTSFTLSQNIFEHHVFRLVCPAEVIDGITGEVFNASKNVIGSLFSIQIDSINGSGSLIFSGVVTQVETAKHSGHAGDIIVTGYSPTVLCDNGPHCKSWEKKALKNIAQDVLKHFPQNLLEPKIAPTNSETLSYMVQYKETAWKFLRRLCATYGEWLFYDGQKLILGPPQGNKVNLIYGRNLHRLNLALQVRPANFQMMGYDYINSEVYNGSPSGIPGKAGLNELGKHALQKSEQFYGTKPKQWNNQFLTNKKQLEDFVNTQAAMQTSNMVRFNGNSDHPAIQLGGTVSIMSKNIFNATEQAFGDYTVVSIHHYCDGQGNYSNEFVAIPASVKVPPVVALNEVYCETQSAIVTDNNDTKGLGRVRVKFHWMNGSEKSPWLRVLSAHAGSGKGLFIMPEIGEEVIAGFEGNSPIKPYIIGSVYNGKSKSDFSNGGNDIKALQSRSGSKVVLDDKAGSVLIEDKDGNNIMLDGAGNINVFSKKNISIVCGENASSITLDMDGNITIRAKNIGVIGSETVGVVSGSGEGDGFSGSGVSIDPKNVNIGAQEICEIAGAKELNMGGAVATLAASGDTNIQGAKVNIN